MIRRVLRYASWFFFSSRRRHTRLQGDWSSDVCSSDLCVSGGERMAKEEAIEVEGRVKEALANTQFRIELDIGGEVIAHVAGKMRKNFIRIIPGDRGQGEISPYDLTRGPVVHRGPA